MTDSLQGTGFDGEMTGWLGSDVDEGDEIRGFRTPTRGGQCSHCGGDTAGQHLGRLERQSNSGRTGEERRKIKVSKIITGANATATHNTVDFQWTFWGSNTGWHSVLCVSFRPT